MVRTAFFAAVMVASTQALSGEFIQGCQTGIFLGSEEQFEDYSCPIPQIAPQAQMYLDMLMPFTNMVKGMNAQPGQQVEHPMLDSITQVTH